jgi:hypothetical protein
MRVLPGTKRTSVSYNWADTKAEARSIDKAGSSVCGSGGSPKVKSWGSGVAVGGSGVKVGEGVGVGGSGVAVGGAGVAVGVATATHVVPTLDRLNRAMATAKRWRSSHCLKRGRIVGKFSCTGSIRPKCLAA